jgi:hypothetical protein
MTLQPLRSQIESRIAAGEDVGVLQTLAVAKMPAPPEVGALLTTQLAVSADLALSSPALASGGDSAIDLTGTADVLGLKGVDLQVTFTASANAWPDIQVVVTLPASWRAGASFPRLAGTPFDGVTLASPAFVFTTAAAGAHAWTDGAGQAQTSTLSRGLSFVADLVPSNVIGLLSAVVQEGASGLRVPLAGTVDLTPLAAGAPSPDIALRGPLGRALAPVSGFTFGTPSVTIANKPGATDGPGVVPRVFVSVPLIVDGRPLLTVAAPVSMRGPYLSIFVEAEEAGLSLAQICSLVAGESITADLPDFLQDAFATVGFRSFYLDIVAASMKPARAGVTVGTLEPWGLADVTVESTTLTFVITDPLGRKQVSRTFHADITFFPQVFPGTFDLLICADDGDGVMVSAEYHGSVSLDTLVSKLTDGAVQIPPELVEVTFEDFGASFTKTGGGWDWQLFGKSDATFTIPMVSGQVEASVTAHVSSTAGQRTYQAAGCLNIGNAFFLLEVDLGPESNLLTGTWALTGGASLGFADLAAAVRLPPPPIPPDLDLALTDAELQYDFGTKSLLVTATSVHYGEAIFVAVSRTTPPLFAFGVSLSLGVRLADIPLVGGRIPDAQNLGIDTATIWVLSRPVTKAEVQVVNARAAAAKFPALPDQDIKAPVVLSADLRLGGSDVLPLRIALGSSSSPPEAAGAAAQEPAAAMSAGPQAPAASQDDGTVWLNVQRQIGIFQLNRIGIGYTGGQLRFALDAAITLGPFALSMDGLSISSPLTSFEPAFSLDGLGVSFNQPPLKIAGALLRLPGSALDPAVEFQFDGTVVIKTAKIALAGIGSYAQLASGDPSLFIFAQLEMPLGGPPAFFVTGLMAGFGFNRSLTIPGMDEVQSFPLLLLAQPPAPGAASPRQDPMNVLGLLEGRIAPAGGAKRQWITPQPGALWFAAGIEFTSFKIANTRALLVVELGDDLTIALLGLSKIRLPVPEQGTPSYAYAEMQLRAVLQPDDGTFMASAILSDSSYVLTPDCHLTGGFAFGLWFGPNPHAGDFVITLGGYHPAFQIPSHYPLVPRLGFNWAVSDAVSIKGDAYFALTPSCVMAGGGLEVLFQEGDLSAWFTAHADLLVSWRPFFFVAAIDVGIGVSFRLNLLFCHVTISLSIGASVDMWGPPTGGKVHVHLVVVTFTVRFGSDNAGADQQPLDWTALRSLLPAPQSVCTITAQGSLAGTADSPASTSQKRWIVRPRGFSFATQSAIPASTLTHTGAPAAPVATASTIAIRPMNKAAVTSTHSVQVTQDTPAGTPVDVSSWRFEPCTQSVPEALWGAPPVPFSQIPAAPSAKTIPGAPVGYTVSIPDPVLGSHVGATAFAVLLEEYISPPGQSPLAPAVQATANYLPSASTATIGQIAQMAAGQAFSSRTALFNALAASGVLAASNGSLVALAAKAAHLFTDAPMQQA